MSHPTSLLTHTHTEFILSYFSIDSLTKDLGRRDHPSGKYIMAARMPVRGSRVDSLAIDGITHITFHLKQDVLHVLDDWQIYSVKFISLNCLKSKWRLHFSIFNDYIRIIACVQMLKEKGYTFIKKRIH